MTVQTFDWRRTVTAKTAAYTITQADSGTLFTNRGATASVTFTLPAPADAYNGVQVEFYGVADQEMVIASASSGDKLVVHNDAAADTITNASGDYIGCSIRAVCDGTSWLIIYQSDSTTAVSWTVA